MSASFTVSIVSANKALDAVLDQLNAGYVKVYTGTRPATVDTALSSNTLLATLGFSATAFAAASARSKTANAISSDTDADASGTATWFRAYKSDGTTAICDGNVGTSAADMIIDSTTVTAHGTVACSSLVISG